MPKILTTWFMNDPQLTHQAISMRQQRKVFTFFHFHPTESPLLLNGGKRFFDRLFCRDWRKVSGEKIAK